MITRTFTKEILLEKLQDEIKNNIPNLDFSISTRSNLLVITILNEAISQQDDEKLTSIVNFHTPSSDFVDQIALTEERNKEGFEVYKKIFAHISTVSPVGQIDPFLQAYPSIMIFRCLMKDGQGESALRFVSKTIKPMNLFPSVDLYIDWIRDFCKKYNSNLTDQHLDAIENLEEV